MGLALPNGSALPPDAAAAGAAEGAALARRIGAELRRAAGVAPLQLLVAQGCAQACRMAGAKLELALAEQLVENVAGPV